VTSQPAAPSSGRVERLAAEAADAAQIRALTTHPDVIALRVEKVRSQVDALLWTGIGLGLAFTMVNVQTFAATGLEPYSLGWWAAWLLDPMVSLVLIAVLRAEQITARYQIELPAWARRTKWLTFLATYTMNTWPSWGLAGAPLSWAGVVLHSVPPLAVFAAAETGPGLRDRLTEAVHRALAEHAEKERAERAPDRATVADLVAQTAFAAVHEVAPEPVQMTAGGPVHMPAAKPARVTDFVTTEAVQRGPAQPVTAPVQMSGPVTDVVTDETPGMPVHVDRGTAVVEPVEMPGEPTAVAPAGDRSDQPEHNAEPVQSPVPVTDDEVLEWIRAETTRARRVPGRKAVIDHWSIGATRADRLRGQVTVPKRLRSVR
jgi:hypothetical protein